jgi:hypothetical protein
MEKLEAVNFELVCATAQTRGILCTPGSVTFVTSVVLATAVVEKSEQPNHRDVSSRARCEQESIALDPSPVVWTVDGVNRRVKLISHELPELIKIVIYLH